MNKKEQTPLERMQERWKKLSLTQKIMAVFSGINASALLAEIIAGNLPWTEGREELVATIGDFLQMEVDALHTILSWFSGEHAQEILKQYPFLYDAITNHINADVLPQTIEMAEVLVLIALVGFVKKSSSF